MKRFLLIVVLLIPILAYSKAKIDSLLFALTTASGDSARVSIYAQLSQEYSDLENFKLATRQLHLGLSVMEKHPDTKEYIWHLISLSNAYLLQQNYEPAMEYARQALGMAKNAGFADAEARAYLNIGAVLIDAKKYQDAEEAILNALTLSVKSNDSLFISYAYNNLGMIYKHQQKYGEALKYLYKALEIKQKIGAPGGTISTIGNIARVFRDEKIYDSALKHFQSALDISVKLGNDFYKAHSYRNIGGLYTELGYYKQAFDASDSALRLSVKNGFSIIQRDSYENLARIMTLQNDYKAAWDYNLRFMALKDSLNELKNQSRVAEMEMLYNKEKEVRQIEALNLENERLLRYFLFTTTIFLIIIIVIIHLRNVKIRKTKKALLESENKFEQLFNEIPDAVFITRYGGSDSGKIINANPAAEQQTGYSKKELLGLNIVKDISIEKQPEPVRLDRENLLMKDNKIEFVERKQRKDGSILWTEVGIQKIRLNDEDLALSVSRDITDRKKAEENLMLSEAKNRSLIDAIPDIIFVINRQGYFVDYHSHSVDLFLVPPENFMHKKVTEILPADIAQTTLQNIEFVLSTGEVKVYDYKLLINGSNLYFDARMAKSSADEVLVIVRNITERRNAEIEIRQREEKYRSIFTNSPVGIFTFNQISEIIDCNENFVEIIGSSREVLIGLNMIRTLKDKKLVNCIQEALLKGYSFYEDNYHSVTASKVTPVKIFLKIIKDSEDNFIEGVGICEDITDQKIYEREIINAMEKAEQSDRMKSAFMATMSHELRTPLNAVIGFSEMIEPSIQPDQIEEFAQIIAKSGKHLLTIIEDIFDIASIESGEVKPFIEKLPLLDIMNDIERFSQEEKKKAGKENLDIIVNIPENLKHILISTDAAKLQKLLLHLLNNALKFTKKGTIEFGLSTETASKNPRNLLFYVKDTGIGIPEEKQQLIFEIFRQADETSTREFEGTGLGLSISKKLIELLGGNIWLESSPGKGSCFYFELPCLDTAFNIMDLIKLQNQPKEKLYDNSLALVAEDDETNFQLFDLLLRRKKIKVLRARNGEEAVELFKQNPDINIVLMDINMPLMNGYEATRHLKIIRNEIPVIAVTAYALSGDDAKAAEAGCDDYLSKPINNKLFYETIFKYL
jgi:PAS domain S-box-containing protein